MKERQTKYLECSMGVGRKRKGFRMAGETLGSLPMACY